MPALAAMKKSKRKILVVSALPYANGDIHLGHLLGYIQADIWSRYQKMRGGECRFICADDAHGTPVMLRAEAEGISPEKLIARMNAAHRRDFAGFGVDFDNYHTTHSEENRLLTEQIFAALQAAGMIAQREVEQLFDPQKKMFLPDRYVRGECPRCGAKDQYGDSCESCGAAYSPLELKNPRSAVSGTTPIKKSSRHYFLRLADEAQWLADWMDEKIPHPEAEGEFVARLQKEARNKMREWLAAGLRDWDISRDPPYFGFEIPQSGGKFFYVWMDAPIGYMASFMNLCAREGLDFDSYWKSEDAELCHFIGKDILYFHALFWPAMLKNSGYRAPSRIFAHGFLTVNGEKMSKSRGTFITAENYLRHGLNPEWLRYYFAAKLNDRIEDLDLNLSDFVSYVNSDLVGKLANIPSRLAGFLAKNFNGEIAESDDWITIDEPRLRRKFEERQFGDVVFDVLRLAEEINRRTQEVRPWELAKDKNRHAELHRALSSALQAFRLLVVVLKPILPQFAAAAESFLSIPPLTWSDLDSRMAAGHRIGEFRHLMHRVEKKQIDSLIESGREEESADGESADEKTPAVTADEFSRMDLRIAVVLAAESVEGADRLLRLTLDVGDEKRIVLAGIKNHYAAESLVGRKVVYLANLAPRKMRFGVSVGMVLAAEDESGVHLLTPDGDSSAGSRVR